MPPQGGTGERYPDAVAPLREWERAVRAKRSASSTEGKRDFPSVDFVGPHRAIFNVRGNEYRLIVDMRFDLSRAFIRHVVNHSECNRIMKRGLL